MPPGSFRRGLQTSGLIVQGDELWSIGDQRSEHPGHVFRIRPESGRMAGPPVRMAPPPARPGESPHFATYRAIANSDFEGLAADPTDPSRLYAVTEDKVPWVAELRVTRRPKAPPSVEIRQLARIRLPAGISPWRDDSNFQMEGIAVSSDGATIYLAFERATDDLPRILRVEAARAREGEDLTPAVVPVDFASLPRRPDKARARLNINDIAFLESSGTSCLLAVARDQERVLLIDLSAGRVTRCIDLDVRDPGGNSILWVSPEGLAVDPGRGVLWVINDPDSVRGNYRRRDTPVADGLYAAYAPLLLRLPLSAVAAPASTR